MNFSKISVKRPVATLMVILVAISFGMLSVMNLSMDLMPNMNIPICLVMTTYDGAGPEEIEKLVTEPVEKAVASISGLDTLQSTSNSGASMVMIQFETSVNVDNAAADVREQIDLVKGTLPEDANEPIVLKLDINSLSGSIYISASAEGKDITELKNLIEDEVSPRLERQSGVASVSIMGGEDKEIKVVVDQEKLRGYGISESTISGMLASENINTPLGTIDQGDKNLTLRVKGEFQSIDDIRNTALTTSTGGTVYVRDVANVFEDYTDASSIAYTNGVPSINMSISKQSTANTIDVSKAVMGELEKIRAEMPDVDFIVISDPADYIESSLASIADSALKGCLLAVIVLYIFLRNFKSTMIVGVSMPVSIVTTFAFMYFFGVNFNLMSMGGLSLGIGMLVDNSIVVLESIYKKLEEGQDRFEAAITGGKEVANSVIASTLTTIVVFLPITFVGGTVGEMFNDMCLTVVFSLASSLLVALTFVPMASSILLSAEEVNAKKSSNIFNKALDVVSNGIDALSTGYKRLLHFVLRHKKVTALVALAFMVFTTVSLSGIGMTFMPESDEGQVSVSIDLPKGTKVEETEKIAWLVVDAIDEAPEIKNISMSMGGGGGMSALMGSSDDSASITIELVEKNERERTSNEVAIDMRKLVKDIAGAEIEITASSNSMGSYSSSGINVKIEGDEMDELEQIGNDLVAAINKIPGTADVKTSIEDASPQTTIRLNRGKATNYGISVASVASLLRTDITGSTATTYKIDGDEYDIKVMQDSEKINYLSDVENLLIPTSFGTSIPLSEIAQITTEDVPVSIEREDQTKYITVSGNLENVAVSQVNEGITSFMSTYNMPDGYSWEFGGSTERMQTAFSGLALALVLAIFLVYMVMAAEFEAFSFPFIVMFSIPLAVTGGLFGCVVFGEPISVTSLLGLIMLAGVVVNNAIVLIDYANLQVRERGLNAIEAMEIAGPVRLRPILMSTLTTVLAMVPMLFSQAEGSEMMRGLAVVVVFGLTLSTLVTLVLIPCIYVAVDKRMNRSKMKREARKAKRAEKRALKA